MIIIFDKNKGRSMKTDKETVVPLRNKLTLDIATQKIKSEKYNSGGGTPELLAKLSISPKQFSIETIGEPKQGVQAKVDYVRIRTISHSAVDIVRKKEKNFSLKKEMEISRSIIGHLKHHEEIKSHLSLPFSELKRKSGNELLLRVKKYGGLETYREYIKKNSPGTETYLFHQTRNLVKTLDFLHNGDFKDEQGNKHKGIIHGDIKPDNILVDKNGDLSLADFGCARYAEEPIKKLGMVSYLSPELLKIYANEVPEDSDKSDIWSLGVTVKSLVTGEYPIEPPPQPTIIAMSPTMSSEDEKDTRGYLVRETKSDTTSYSSYLRKDEISGYIAIEPKQVGDAAADFFTDTSQGHEIRVKKADEYLQSEVCKKNLESKRIIEDLCKDPSNSDIDRKEILHHLTSSMLLPVEERPTARKLTETMNKLAPYFPYDQKANSEFVEKMTASVRQVVKESNPATNEPLSLEKEKTLSALRFKEENKVLPKQVPTQPNPKLSASRQPHKKLLDLTTGSGISASSSFFHAPKRTKLEEKEEEKIKKEKYQSPQRR